MSCQYWIGINSFILWWHISTQIVFYSVANCPTFLQSMYWANLIWHHTPNVRAHIVANRGGSRQVFAETRRQIFSWWEKIRDKSRLLRCTFETIRENFETRRCALRHKTRLTRSHNVETRRDETRISSRLAEKCVETLKCSSFIGLLLVYKDLIFAIFGMFNHFKWVFGLKAWYCEFLNSDSWVETDFSRDETRQEIVKCIKIVQQ